MQLIVSDLAQFKNNNRDPEPLPGIVTSVHDVKVDLTIIRGAILEAKRNVTLAENAESAEAGQCWVPKRA